MTVACGSVSFAVMLRVYLALFCALTWADAAPPNILFIVADDQRPDTIHALGNAVIQTPNLDRLSARGVVFSHAHAAYPICHVSRAEILTGCCAFRALPSYPGGAINPELKTLAATLRAGGYHTWYTGKWHNDGQPKQRGYETTRGLYSSGGAKGYVTPELDERGHPLTGYKGWTFKTDDGKVELDKGVGLQPATSRHIGDAAVSVIAEAAGKGPFFLHVNFTAPHDPRLMPPGWETAYPPASLPLPRNFAPQHPFDHGNIDGRDELLLPRPRMPEAVKVELEHYYALISDVDAQVGRMIAALEAAGQLENTLVVYTSDQGLAMGSHGLLGKQNQYEHTSRVPLILAGPGIPLGQEKAALCYLRDLFSTFCGVAGLEVPDTVQGLSLLPVIRGEKDRLREEIIGYFTDTQRMIRDDRWKLIVYPQVGKTQLFDLQADPDELHDLSADPAQTERRQQMLTRLRDWLKDQGDRLADHLYPAK